MYLSAWKHQQTSLLRSTSQFTSFIPTDIQMLHAGITSIFLMKEKVNRTSNTSLKCVLKTQVKLSKSILFLSQLQKIRDLALEEITCH